MLVACSGGPDSVALTHGLDRLGDELGLDLHVASVDHGLRPAAAAEVAGVGALAGRLGLPFHPLRVRVDVAGGASPMAAARRARYAALNGLAARLGAPRVAVGHTLDDQAETVLGRLLRGATLEGLAGIAPRRRDGIVRPLIDARRADVLAYLERHRLSFVEDPTNRDPRYERPRLRDHWLPALAEAEDPRLPEHLAALADQARGLRRRTARRGRQLARLARRGDALGVARLRGASLPVRHEALRRWLRGRLPAADGHRLGGRHLAEIDAALEAGRGVVPLPGGHRVIIEPGRLRVEPAGPPTVREGTP